ncbi:MAG: biopolymer transporter ExbD [Verrucomicrobiota bacterium]
MARTRKDIFAGGKPSLNISAMIDLVFLLLIFFMVASKMITVPQIEGVVIPIADASQVPRDVKGRVVINVTNEGKILDGQGTVELSAFEIQQLMTSAKTENPNVKLHLRTDQGVEHRHVREVMQASAKGGVTDVIFSTYQTQ